MGTYQKPTYLHSVADAAGVVAANNFLSVFNPAGSPVVLSFVLAVVDGYATGMTGGTASIQVLRTTAASGGTLIAADEVNRFRTPSPDTSAEVRTGNPTVTIDADHPHHIAAWPPPQTTGVGGRFSDSARPVGGTGFLCFPGQGLVYRTASGTTAQRWGVSFVWQEVRDS